MRINYRLGWLAVGGRGGRRAGSRVPLDGGRDTKQRGEDEAVVSADLQTNEHASERDGQPADLSDILRCVEDARSFISLFRLGVREKKGGMRVSEARGLSVCVCVAECRCCVWLEEGGGLVPWRCWMWLRAEWGRGGPATGP